jgi:hypothetical protein
MDDAQAGRLAGHISNGEILEVEITSDFLVYRLTDARLQPAADFDGGWALETTLDKQVIILRACAAATGSPWAVRGQANQQCQWRGVG